MLKVVTEKIYRPSVCGLAGIIPFLYHSVYLCDCTSISKLQTTNSQTQHEENIDTRCSIMIELFYSFNSEPFSDVPYISHATFLSSADHDITFTSLISGLQK